MSKLEYKINGHGTLNESEARQLCINLSLECKPMPITCCLDENGKVLDTDFLNVFFND